MVLTKYFTLFIPILSVSFAFPLFQKNPLGGLLINDLVRQYGYNLENHSVTTEDGYVLGLHRLLHPTIKPTRGVVFLVHGFVMSSSMWVELGPDRSLGFLYVNLGYDVWLANCRPNLWSRNHITLDPDKEPEEFFNFSWHEIGVYDLPAMIDYILDKTQEKQLIYVGHSQGTTTFFVMTSMRPEYNEKIKMMHALAPVVFCGNMESSVVNVGRFAIRELEDTFEAFQTFDLPFNRNFSLYLSALGDSPIRYLTPRIYFAVGGTNWAQVDYDTLPVIFTSIPAGAATKQIFHYLQLKKSGFFQQYDYGLYGNQKIYGSSRPPQYDLKKVTSPVFLHHGANDLLSAVIDVEKLASVLPNLQGRFLIEDANFAHSDFIYAKDIRKLLNDRIINQTEIWMTNEGKNVEN